MLFSGFCWYWEKYKLGVLSFSFLNSYYGNRAAGHRGKSAKVVSFKLFILKKKDSLLLELWYFSFNFVGLYCCTYFSQKRSTVSGKKNRWECVLVFFFLGVNIFLIECSCWKDFCYVEVEH